MRRLTKRSLAQFRKFTFHNGKLVVVLEREQNLLQHGEGKSDEQKVFEQTKPTTTECAR